MITSGYFNSVDGDRKYNADDMSNYFEGLVTEGVFKSVGSALKVSANAGMTVKVGSGKAIVLNKWVRNTSSLTLTISDSDALKERYDAIVVKCDLSQRTISIEVKAGTAAESSPEKPTLVDSGYIKEICLAYIHVAAGVASLTSSDIEDTREDNALCGWVRTLTSNTVSTYMNKVTLAEQSSTVPIGISEFSPDIDTLFVYANGLIMVPVDEYMINGTGSEAYIDLANPLEAGNEILFVVLCSKVV